MLFIKAVFVLSVQKKEIWGNEYISAIATTNEAKADWEPVMFKVTFTHNGQVVEVSKMSRSQVAAAVCCCPHEVKEGLYRDPMGSDFDAIEVELVK